MSRPALELVLYLVDEAFRGKGLEASNESQALLTNLATVREADWRAVLPGADRTIEKIVLHVGACKVMYDDYAFGPGTLFWTDSKVEPWPAGKAPMVETIEWLEEVHERLVEHVAALSDADLTVPRLTNWGEQRETRWIVSVMLQHDLYHAGEINHIRSLLSGDDRWLFERETSESVPTS
ncbi:MAG TPA: DinB family protein [Candidatus Limnocylindria bacterium]|nr:DinB family protein [Candidatus Limnocylindria bacterium]